MPHLAEEKIVKTSRFRYVPNAISVARIFLSLSLLFWLDHPLIFGLVYLACGISDVLDGFIARMTKTQSNLGAKLDSIGDLFLTGVIVVAMLVWVGDRLSTFYPVLLAIVAVRAANLGLAAFKFHTFAILHTWANKATGLLLFVTPVVFIVAPRTEAFYPVCFLALLSAAEESLILIFSSKLELNRRSLFKN